MATTVIPNQHSFSETFLNSLYEISDGYRLRTCLQCGDCSGVCPFGHVMAYPPHKIIAYLRADLFDRVLDNDTAWMCVSCYACTEVCPSKIPVTHALMTRTKEEMLLAGTAPNELQDALRFSERYGNPLGESPRKRAAWAKNLTPEIPILRKAQRPVDVLWFVGDYASYHPRVQKVSKSVCPHPPRPKYRLWHPRTRGEQRWRLPAPGRRAWFVRVAGGKEWGGIWKL